MNKTCVKWRDQLLETALGEIAGNELEAHLSRCSDCAGELSRLRARRERLDTLLPMIAAEEPPADLVNRTLAATQSATMHRAALVWQRWAIAVAVAVIMIAVITGFILNSRTNTLDPDLPGAIALAHWQPPTDALLQLPNHELLNSVPKLDDSYLALPMEMQKGEKQ